MKKKQTICYVAGKSGGHIIPCLTFAREHKEKHPEDNILFFTTETILDIEIVTNSPDINWHIPLPLNNVLLKKWHNIFTAGFNMALTMMKSLFYLIKHRPNKIVCTGGFLAIPVIICARILAIPVQLYELNVEPGRATRFLASWSIDLFTCFEQTQAYLPQKKCIKTSYPIRFFGESAQISQKDALQKLLFSPERKTICILGGSQGSLEINHLMQQWIVQHPHLHEQIQIIHQTGRQDSFNWKAFYTQHNITHHVFSFSHEMAIYYAAADLIICRSGAGTLFEILFFGKQCITIPLQTPTNNHQVTNALAMQEEYGELFTTITKEQLTHNKQALSHHIMDKLKLNTMQSETAPYISKEL
ncbi:MAG: UDP-N-acetylglucosamine--N-acetylmuramyl-(pentapeptide) pyrophosphoryl-undecaprenol N-acetylglucosamine transferase [Candidatus Dependentiae bacterium]